MQLCMSMWSFQELLTTGRMDFSGFADYCVTHGITYVELLDFFVEKDLDACLGIMDKKQLIPAVWSICNDFVQPTKELRQKQIEYTIHQIDIASRINAPLMRVFSGDVKESVCSFEEGMASIMECYVPCVAHAARQKVTLCLENHGVFAATSQQVSGLLSVFSSPYMRSNFDMANFLFVDESPLDAAKNLSGQVSLLHVKDYASSPEHVGWPTPGGLWYEGCPLGQGVVPIQQILAILSQGGFDGVASIELESPHPIAAADTSIAYLRNIGL